MGSSLWGISGTAANLLFREHPAITPLWLLAVRMLAGGMGLCVMVIARKPDRTGFLTLLRDPRALVSVAVFSIMGLTLVQYTYFSAIDASSVAAATLLQYMGPAIILLYASYRAQRWPTAKEASAVALALVGLSAFLTNGFRTVPTISVTAYFWGFASAFALAFYTVYPRRLLRQYGTLLTVAVSLLFSGMLLSPEVLFSPWPRMDHQTWALISVIVVGGTILAFLCYLGSLSRLTVVEASVGACVEPVAAVLAGVLVLHLIIHMGSVIGGGVLLGAVVWQAQGTVAVPSST